MGTRVPIGIMSGMTDRLVVSFRADLREGDVERILSAIKLLRGVAAVTPLMSDPLDAQALERHLKAVLLEKIQRVFSE